MVDVAASTLQGRTHKRNEDAWLVLGPEAEGVRDLRRGALFAVCDGVSAVPDGNWAAQTTCSRLEAFFDQDLDPSLDALLQLINEIDWELRGRGQGRAACTLSALWLVEGMANVIQVGDSDIFWLRHGQLNRVTTGDSEGRQLRSFMGMGPQLNEVVQTWREPFFPGDLFLLATDGLLDTVNAREILDTWWGARARVQPFTGSLIDRVKQRRGADDATVVAVDVLSVEQARPGAP